MRHAGVLVMSSEADIGRVSASELFSQQTCKWIPNGLFTYITLARAPPQARLHQPIRCPSILLLPDSWCNDSVQRTLHLCCCPAPAQCGAGAADAAQPPLPGDKRAEHRAKIPKIIVPMKTIQSQSHNLTMLQSHNHTTLQLYNLTIVQPHNLTMLPSSIITIFKCFEV